MTCHYFSLLAAAESSNGGGGGGGGFWQLQWNKQLIWLRAPLWERVICGDGFSRGLIWRPASQYDDNGQKLLIIYLCVVYGTERWGKKKNDTKTPVKKNSVLPLCWSTTNLLVTFWLR